MVGWLNQYLDINGESVIEWTEAFNSEDAMVAWYGLLWWVTRLDVECCIHSRYSKASATSAFYLANKIPIEHRRPFGRQSDTLQLNFPSNMLASQLQISILECSSNFGTIHVPKLCPWSQDISSWFWCSQTWISLAKASSPGSCCKSRNCFLSAIRSLRCESAEDSSWLMQSDANCKWNSRKIVDKNENIYEFSTTSRRASRQSFHILTVQAVSTVPVGICIAKRQPGSAHNDSCGRRAFRRASCKAPCKDRNFGLASSRSRI